MALFRVDFQGSVYGLENFQHGHHISSTDSSAGVAADAAAAWLALLADAALNTFYTTGIVWSQVNVSELGTTPADPILTSAQAVIADGGTSADAGLPAQCAPCVSLSTATAGSRARGRMFLPPPDVTAVTTTGRLAPAFLTAAVNALETYFQSWAGNAGDVVVVSAIGGVYTTASI